MARLLLERTFTPDRTCLSLMEEKEFVVSPLRPPQLGETNTELAQHRKWVSVFDVERSADVGDLNTLF